MDLEFSTTEHTDGLVVLAVHGEVDVATAPQLRERLVAIMSAGNSHVVLDLQGVGFLDSTGLGVIVGCLKRARSNQGDLTLVCTSPSILKVLDITGLTNVFSIFDDVDEAVADGGGSGRKTGPAGPGPGGSGR
jgi:anti-sigma B factor antagonist